MSQRNKSGFSFGAMVAGTMALLKMKEKYDDYRQVSDDEEGRVALVSAQAEDLQGDGHIALLDTEIPSTRSIRTKKKKSCCMCCGLDCSLFWKAIAIVLGLYTLYYGYKAISWAMTEAPTGLEGMPAFEESLGCKDAPFIYNNTAVTVNAPLGSVYADHGFDVRGYGVGIITIADGEADAKEVKYEITIQSNKEDLLKDVAFVYPNVNSDGVVTRSRFIIETSRIPGVDDKYCMKYNIMVYVPPNLKKLHIASHSAASQIQFTPGSRLSIDELYVTTYNMDEKNMILINKDITPKKLSLEVYRGWIVGDASIVEETTITTQRGDGVSNVKLHPTLPTDSSNTKKAILRTTTGAGRSDFTYIGRKESKRQIDSTHISSRNADLYLTYREAEFVGKVQIESKSFTMTGATPWNIRLPGSSTGSETESGSARRDDEKWTHFVGSREGTDEIYVNSRGWTGLYF